MLDSATFDVALGMVFIFLMLSLVCVAVREAIEARLRSRAKHLIHGIAKMLGARATTRLYEHPLVKGLYDSDQGPPVNRFLEYQGHRCFSWVPALLKSLLSTARIPSYIPSRVFATAMLDMAQSGALFNPQEARTSTTDPSRLIEALRTELAKPGKDAEADAVSRAMLSALALAGGDVDKAIKSLEQWYDSAMDRVSGWYKRESQHIIFWIALLVAVGLNVDSIFLIKFLHNDDEGRKALVGQIDAAIGESRLKELTEQLRQREAADAAPSPPLASATGSVVSAPTVEELHEQVDSAKAHVREAVRQVTSLNLPIGWGDGAWTSFRKSSPAAMAMTALGWLLTAFGVSFGAPFWFDVLNKLMVIRSTVKPHEKSPEEQSEDRQWPAPTSRAGGQAASPGP